MCKFYAANAKLYHELGSPSQKILNQLKAHQFSIIQGTHLSPCATRASLARFPATTTRFRVSRAKMLPPCHPMAFISSGTTWKKKFKQQNKIFVWSKTVKN